MEYNTQREQLKITDYGRIVCKMIEYAKSLPNRNERTQMAHTIVSSMALVNPKIKERSDYRRILWDHLMLMADYQLDVDSPYPYPVNRPSTVSTSPMHIGYVEGNIRYRHYGRALEDMIAAVAEMPPGDERTQLTEQLAHTMKRQYLQWNRDSVDDNLIREQLAELSDGRLVLPDSFQFRDSKIYLDAMAAAAKKEPPGKKKKKKKKKQHQQQ